MWQELQRYLRGPQGQGLRLEVFEEADDWIAEGVLHSEQSSWFPIVHGVPCFLQGSLRPDFSAFAARRGLHNNVEPGASVSNALEQGRTNVTFSDKWRRFKHYGLEPSHEEFLFGWYQRKLGLSCKAELEEFYRSHDKILEVGPGSGFNSKFIASNTDGVVFAADISEAAITVAENTRHLRNCHVLQADLNELPFDDGMFDLILADGVLHHTPNTRQAVRSLYKKLRPGGQFYFYVYRKMGPLRQYCDEFVRSSFTKMSPEECYEACEGFTELGRELHELNATVELSKGIPILGLPAGEHNVQRLIYYTVLKCFWNDAFDFETNNMVNFDWYHPHNAWQHTEEEVAGWLAELGVTEFEFHDSNPNGISVLLIKPETDST